MSSVQVVFNADELSVWDAALERMGDPALEKPILDAMGGEVETQTRRRIQSEKTAPDGTAWPKWSARYAKTRHGGQSLLQSDGYLSDSINYQVLNHRVVVGSNRVYAAAQQAGYEKQNLPARPYLGLSEENQRDVEDVLLDVLTSRI